LLLFLQAYLQLILLEFYLQGDFAALHRRVRKRRVLAGAPLSVTAERVCHAIDFACICYWKEVRCLQRAAATTYLLKKYGMPGEMVIGAQQLPFKAHAWVEIDGRVVNDKPYMKEIYSVLERC
jgi:Transglutaminase-like superfamily